MHVRSHVLSSSSPGTSVHLKVVKSCKNVKPPNGMTIAPLHAARLQNYA